jgi:pimeloyl-ACP methyl ester carboxylesterase
MLFLSALTYDLYNSYYSHSAFEEPRGMRTVREPGVRDITIVIAVQLPLHSLADEVATIKRAIELIGRYVIVAGHSYGRFVITNAAYNNPNVKDLVYVAAFALKEGQSLDNFVECKRSFQKDLLIIDSGGFAYINPAIFAGAIAQDVDPIEAETMAAVQKPFSK